MNDDNALPDIVYIDQSSLKLHTVSSQRMQTI